MHTYDVYWEENKNITWATRWDSYSRMPWAQGPGPPPDPLRRVLFNFERFNGAQDGGMLSCPVCMHNASWLDPIPMHEQFWIDGCVRDRV
jgi:hypothetical protein